MAKNYDPSQWGRRDDSPPIHHGAVNEADLAVAAALFPPVRCVCETCNGEQQVYDGTSLVPCHTCEGLGFFLREMDSREEHYYILHLLQRYQLR